jgi:metal-responsive CopG/Arc/MetJ family transcriptional regulator
MGRPLLVDPKYRKEVSIVLDQRDLDRFKEIAYQDGTTWAEMVRDLMKDYIRAYDEFEEEEEEPLRVVL